MQTITGHLTAAILIPIALTTAALAETLEGPCALVYDERGRTVSHQVQLGRVIQGTCEFKLMEFGGGTAITANGVFRNTGDQPMAFAYYVSFFDKDRKLVGSTSFVYWSEETALGPGERARPSSCIIRIPDAARDNVASYQVAFYEEEREP